MRLRGKVVMCQAAELTPCQVQVLQRRQIHESKWVNPAQTRVEEQVEQCQVAQALEGTCDDAQVVEAQIELCDSRHVREDSR